MPLVIIHTIMCACMYANYATIIERKTTTIGNVISITGRVCVAKFRNRVDSNHRCVSEVCKSVERLHQDV